MNYKWKVHQNNRKTSGIDEYFSDAEWLWRRDANERSVFDLWLHVIDHCTRLVEAVRKERPKEVLDDLADTTMWMFSFVAQLHRSNAPIDAIFKIQTMPSDLIWNKYPGRCPACFDFEIAQILQAKTADEATVQIRKRQDEIKRKLMNQVGTHIVRTCNCLSRITFAEERHKIYKAISWEIDKLRLYYADMTRRKYKFSSFTDFELMFETIFINAYYVFSIQVVAFHLLEEVGEVTQALKDCYTFDKDREPFSEEVMDKRRK